MADKQSQPQDIPSATGRNHITKSAPTGFNFCGGGPGLSSTGERNMSVESNVFERVPVPSKTSIQSQKPLSALGSKLTESVTPAVSNAASWMMASFGTSPIISESSDEKAGLASVTPPAASPVEIPIAQTWNNLFHSTETIPESTSSSANTNPTHQTLPRMSRNNQMAHRQQWARRSFSTKNTNSPATILVKKKASEIGSSKHSSVSPITSESFSSLAMSPAVSFLSSFTEQPCEASPADLPLTGLYSPGDCIGDYTLIREIGSGCFSKVFEASSNDPKNPFVAIKIIHSDANLTFDKTALQKESYLWSRLSHPHLLRMFESFDSDDAVFVVTELAQGGHLLDYVLKEGRPGLSESVALPLFKQLASAVSYLHLQAGIIHRDIKLENILLDKSMKKIKLSDFGLSESVSDSFWDDFETARANNVRPNSGHSRSVSVNIGSVISVTDQIPLSAQDARCFAPGSLHYCAPEILKQTKSSKLPSDIWSMGCVLHALLTGCLPFNDSYLPRLQMSIINGRWDPSRLEKAQVSSKCINLITGMLQLRVEDRYSISEVINHPWLKS